MSYIYYFYKITNLINQKYYYGVHKQDMNKPDRYMGSGHILKKAIKKYGIKNFSKEIIKYFNCEDDMYDYERKIVSREFINSQNLNCYNVIQGGNRSPMSGRKHLDSVKKRIKDTCKKTHKRLKNEYLKTGVYPDSLKWIEKQSGYNNPDFVKRWKPLYESNKDLVIELLIHSNLSDSIISNIVFKQQKVKISKVINYYIQQCYLEDILNIKYTKEFISDNFNCNTKCLVTNSKKTIFKNTDIKYYFIFKHDEFFETLNKFIEVSSNLDISDSMIMQNTLNDDNVYFPAYKTYINYFSELGIIQNIRHIKVKGKGLTRNRLANKTIFDLDFTKMSKILIDKEFNCYEFDDNGRLVQKGAFELEVNGRKYSLRYK